MKISVFLPEFHDHIMFSSLHIRLVIPGLVGKML